jgi:TPR repeat protein
MYTLGVTYQQGFLVKKDPVKAAFWHGKAAKKGCAKNQTEIGIMYYHGRGGLDINMKESLSCFRAAAVHGEPEALHRAAIMLRYGCGCNRDDAEAYTYLEISAFLHNNLDAHFEIGLFLYEGLHLSRCMKKAATRPAFMVATRIATKVFAGPRSTYDTATVTTVRKISAEKIPIMKMIGEMCAWTAPSAWS